MLPALPVPDPETGRYPEEKGGFLSLVIVKSYFFFSFRFFTQKCCFSYEVEEKENIFRVISLQTIVVCVCLKCNFENRISGCLCGLFLKYGLFFTITVVLLVKIVSRNLDIK